MKRVLLSRRPLQDEIARLGSIRNGCGEAQCLRLGHRTALSREEERWGLRFSNGCRAVCGSRSPAKIRLHGWKAGE